MVTVFREKLNLQLFLIFCSSIRFVSETAFFLEQIAQNRFGALLEIIDKFITKFNVVSYMILLFKLETVWEISKPYCMTLKTVAGQFCLKGHSLYQKNSPSEFLEMVKYLKRNHSVSYPPYKFFMKKLCVGEQTFLGQMFCEIFYMGTNNQIMQGVS